jgi:protein-export membrane protein SecD
MQKNRLILVFIFLLTILSGFFIVPRSFGEKYMPWRLGLDLVGGSALVYEVDLTGVPQEEYGATIDGLKEVIERRVNQFGVSEPRITIAEKNGDYQLLVELAGVGELADAVREIGETPNLDFRELIDIESEDGEVTQVFVKSELTGRHIVQAQLAFDQMMNNQPVVTLEFDEEGAEIFADLTERNIGKPVAIFIDEELFDAPVPSEKITGGKAFISGGEGGFSIEEARNLAGRLNAGALSAPIELINQRTVSASAAEDALYAIVYAGIVGTLLVLLFMVMYYRLFGVFASVALIIYVILSLAAFKILPGFTMTLSGIAGFILSIGMAVDANILIFERTKEELARGLSKTAAIEEGFARAWTSIRDSNITTIISSFILYYFTTSFVRGFALTLGVGVVISMFTAIFVTRRMLKIFMHNS